MIENFPNLGKGNITQVQKAQRVSIKMNPNRPTPRHMIIKIQNFRYKERILKVAREKQHVTDKGATIYQLISSFY